VYKGILNMKIFKLSLILLSFIIVWSCRNEGCTDPDADNYDSNATSNDGSCVYSGCTDAKAINYNENAEIDDNSCIYCNCNDTLATNYDSEGGTSNKYNPCRYNVTLYTKSVLSEPIHVYYQDSLIGILTSSLLKEPECGDAGTVIISLPHGRHYFTTDAVSYEITADIEKAPCNIVQLYN